MAVKIPYRNKTSFLVSRPNVSGSRYRTDFCESFDENGVKVVKESGQTDFQAYIDSFLPDVDIYTILSRILCDSSNPRSVSLALDSYLSAHEVSGIYADISSFPDNIHAVNKSYTSIVEFFNSLPASVRHDFHNSVDEFVAGFDVFVAKYSDRSGSGFSDGSVDGSAAGSGDGSADGFSNVVKE